MVTEARRGQQVEESPSPGAGGGLLYNRPLRVLIHPLLGKAQEQPIVPIRVDGQEIQALEGEPILAAMLANGLRVCRTSARLDQPRGLFCGAGRCTDCMMVVDGQPNTLTCVTPVRQGMVVETQRGPG